MPRKKLASTPGGMGIIQFCGHSNKILVLNLCPLGSFSIQAQEGDGESRISEDGLILDINTFARCLENVDLFSRLLFTGSCVCISVFLSFYRKPLGEGRICCLDWEKK